MNVILHGGDTRQFDQLKRREFITPPHGSAVWPLAARAQQGPAAVVGLRIVLFEACSAFTRVTACTLALSPYIVTRYPKASATSLPP